jgi:hypothetical protein
MEEWYATAKLRFVQSKKNRPYGIWLEQQYIWKPWDPEKQTYVWKRVGIVQMEDVEQCDPPFIRTFPQAPSSE